MIPAVAIASFAFGLIAGVVVLMRFGGGRFGGLVVLIAAAFGVCFALSDNINWAVAAFLVCLPAGSGALAGGVLGYLLRRVRLSGG